MTSKRTKLQEDTHFRVLRLLQENPEMSQRELAVAVGVSVGGIHYVLNESPRVCRRPIASSYATISSTSRCA